MLFTPIAHAVTGDANGDGIVDGLDYLVLADEFWLTSQDGVTLSADFNDDGIVDGLDYLLLIDYFGQTDEEITPTYWVASDGNDSNPGTASRPFRTIQRAAQAARAGDVVSIGTGSYAGWTAVRSGTADLPIVFIGQGANTVIDGNGRTGEGFYSNQKDNIAIASMVFRSWQRDGILLRDCEGISIADVETAWCGWRGAGWDHGISLERVQNTSISDVYSHDNYIAGIEMSNCDHISVDHCTATRNTGTSGSDGIIVQNSRYIDIADCEATHNGEDGIDIAGYEGTPYDTHSITIVRCTASQNTGEGFAVSGTSGSQFRTYNVTIDDCTATYNNGDGVQIYQRAFDVIVRYSDISYNRRGFNLHTSAHDVDIISNRVVSNRAEPWSIDDSCWNVVLRYNVTNGG
ncbi:MAG: right-handed parallel beta-helix repeat-containing protein [Pirellulales bacterium]